MPRRTDTVMSARQRLTAEDAYLFRHGLLRDVAYQLQLPGSRARLHELALNVLDDYLRAMASPALAEALAEEMAWHARHAALDADPTRRAALGAREIALLEHALTAAERDYCIHHAGELARRLADHPLQQTDGRIELLRRSAGHLRTQGRLREEEAALQEALRLAGGVEGNDRRARLLAEQAENLRQQGLLAQSQAALEQARASANATSDRNLDLYLRSMGAHLDMMEGRFEAALNAYRELSRRDDLEPGRRVSLLMGAGVALGQAGRLQESDAEFTAALEIARAHHLLSSAGVLEMNLGTNAWSRSDTITARRHYEAAQTLFRACGDMRRMPALLLSFGTLASQEGEPALALKLYDEGESLALEQGDRVNTARIRNNRGAALRQIGRPQQAVEVLRANLADVARGPMRVTQAKCLLNLGLSQLASGEGASASDTLGSALRLYGELRLMESMDVLYVRAALAIIALQAKTGDARSLAAEALACAREPAHAAAIAGEPELPELMQRLQVLLDLDASAGAQA